MFEIVFSKISKAVSAILFPLSSKVGLTSVISKNFLLLGRDLFRLLKIEYDLISLDPSL